MGKYTIHSPNMASIFIQRLKAAIIVAFGVLPMLIPLVHAINIPIPSTTTDIAETLSGESQTMYPTTAHELVQDEFGIYQTYQLKDGCYNSDQQSSCTGSCAAKNMICSDHAMPSCTTAFLQGTDHDDKTKYTFYRCGSSSTQYSILGPVSDKRVYRRETPPPDYSGDDQNPTTSESSTSSLPYVITTPPDNTVTSMTESTTSSTDQSTPSSIKSTTALIESTTASTKSAISTNPPNNEDADSTGAISSGGVASYTVGLAAIIGAAILILG